MSTPSSPPPARATSRRSSPYSTPRSCCAPTAAKLAPASRSPSPGARTVAEQAVTFGRLSPFAQPALTNGTAGVVVIADGRPLSIMAFTVTAGKIATIEVLTDPDRLTHLDLSAFNQA